jgi:hypothetical protein
MAQHLIHVGYAKAGSTFLQAWFKHHPELCYRHGGLGGFHNVYQLSRPSSHGAFKYYVTSDEALTSPHEEAGEVPLVFGYAEMICMERAKEKQETVCSTLKSLYPGSLILIVTRGFKGGIISFYSQYVRTGGRLHLRAMCRAFAECLRTDDRNYADVNYCVRLYGEAFGEGNVIVMPYELLRDDQNRFLAVLEERLGIAHDGVELGRLNPSLSPEELYWYPLISRAVAAAAARLGEARFRRIYRWYLGKIGGTRLRPLIRALRLLRPGGKITEADFAEDILLYCKGKATLLKENPLYAPYAAEYLWDE